MSPAEADLARTYVALPGAPVWDPVHHPDRILWRWLSCSLWVPNITDEATGGAMLARFGAEVGLMVTRVLPSAGGPPVYYVDLDIGGAAYCGEGATLGEAVARAAIAAGRAS